MCFDDRLANRKAHPHPAFLNTGMSAIAAGATRGRDAARCRKRPRSPRRVAARTGAGLSAARARPLAVRLQQRVKPRYIGP